MSYRLQVTIADDLADELEHRAQAAGQPASRVAATLINLALSVPASPTTTRGTRRSDIATRDTTRQPSWIEPFADHEQCAWRSALWAAVLALCARYPKQLARLEATWWRDRARTEQLAALAAWRGAIDHAGQDPREELAFHAQLADLGYLLEHLPGGADTFQPGPPPHEWLDPTQH